MNTRFGIVIVAIATLFGTLASANTLEERLRGLYVSHELAIMEVPNNAMRRLMRGFAPSEESEIYTKAYLKTVPVVEGDKQWRCMAEALYFEARGESVKGQFAVAEVILNRVADRKFPDTVCGVVLQGSGRGLYKCQFSYTCDGKKEIISEPRAWENVGKVARLAMLMDERPLTHGATYYHTNYVSPSWSKKFPQTATIGVHLFYKEPDRITSR